MLNNDHFEFDLKELERLNDFNADLSLPAPRHAAYVKAVEATRIEHDALLSYSTNAEGTARRSMALGLSTGTDCRIGCGKPDKPGTVRAPGSRFVPRGLPRKARWANY